MRRGVRVVKGLTVLNRPALLRLGSGSSCNSAGQQGRTIFTRVSSWLAARGKGIIQEREAIRILRRRAFLRLERLENRDCPSLAITNNPAAANVNLSQRAGTQAETTVAINPANSDQIFVGAVNNGGAGMFASNRARVNGNPAWNGRTIATGAQGGDSLPQASADPSAAYDTFGNLFLTYITTAANQEKGQTTATAAQNGNNSLIDSTRSWGIGEWTGCQIQITAGPGAGPDQYTITSNTATQLFISGTWAHGNPDLNPAASSYAISTPKGSVVAVYSTDGG
jgi:hypothetical protein